MFNFVDQFDKPINVSRNISQTIRKLQNRSDCYNMSQHKSYHVAGCIKGQKLCGLR